MWLVYRVRRSIAVADVPGCGLALRGREGERATLSERLTVGGRPCHHGVVLLSVGCHDGGKVRCFVHALSMAADGGQWGKWWTVSGLPHGTTATLLNLLRGQAATLPKELRLTPVPRGCIVLTEGSEVGAYALVVVHETIIGTGWDDSRAMVDTLATEHQISDGVGVSIGATPADGVTVRGAHPDHALLTPELPDPESVVHIGCPVAPVRIKLAPCRGLNCDGVGHVLCLN